MSGKSRRQRSGRAPGCGHSILIRRTDAQERCRRRGIFGQRRAFRLLGRDQFEDAVSKLRGRYVVRDLPVDEFR